MLVEMAIADAYGAAFEFMPARFIRKHNKGSDYVAHADSRIPMGHYTDDTQMSLAIAELLIEDVEWTRLAIASKFVEVFKRDPRPGYAGGFYQFLTQVEDGEAFLQHIRPISSKSGAAMRSAPLGVLPDIVEVIGKTHIQASVTHNTPDGINSALAVALASHFFKHDVGSPQELPSFLSDYLPGDWRTPWRGEVSVEGMDCVRAALTSIQNTSSLRDVLVQSVAYGGDTDTVACIAVGIVAGNYENDLSEELYEGLENGQYGTSYLDSVSDDMKGEDGDSPLFLEHAP